jgi:hypothetical protein
VSADRLVRLCFSFSTVEDDSSRIALVWNGMLRMELGSIFGCDFATDMRGGGRWEKVKFKMHPVLELFTILDVWSREDGWRRFGSEPKS